MTYGLEGRCSIQLSYERIKTFQCVKRLKNEVKLYRVLPFMSSYESVCAENKESDYPI